MSKPKRTTQARAETALAACLPDVIRAQWIADFRYQNTILRESGEEPLSAAEFIAVKLDTFLGCGSPF